MLSDVMIGTSSRDPADRVMIDDYIRHNLARQRVITCLWLRIHHRNKIVLRKVQISNTEQIDIHVANQLLVLRTAHSTATSDRNGNGCHNPSKLL